MKLEERKEIIKGKIRMIITSSASGIDKTREAVLLVMGQGYEYIDDKKDNKTK